VHMHLERFNSSDERETELERRGGRSVSDTESSSLRTRSNIIERLLAAAAAHGPTMEEGQSVVGWQGVAGLAVAGRGFRRGCL
jgi:hypothetical protein